jgi:hypothetical protein
LTEEVAGQPELVEIVDKVNSIRKSIDMNCEKLQVALTGVFRLLDGERAEILSGLGGSQEDLRAYIVKLVSELRRDSDDQFVQLQHKLEKLLKKEQA